MAIGSRRRTPTLPVVAAVVSDDSVAPRKTPCCQLRASKTSGTFRCRRAPKRTALMGTPSGASHFGEMDGHWLAGGVKRLVGCAALSVEAGGPGPAFPAQTVAGGGASGP